MSQAHSWTISAMFMIGVALVAGLRGLIRRGYVGPRAWPRVLGVGSALYATFAFTATILILAPNYGLPFCGPIIGLGFGVLGWLCGAVLAGGDGGNET